MKTLLQNLFNGLLLLTIMALSTTSQATPIIINDSISENLDANSAFVSRSVDFFKFSTTGGSLTFDVLASDLANGLDDSMIWLFNDDGHLDLSDWLSENDDTDFATNGNSDNSLNEMDSFLTTILSAGNYVLAVGSGGDFGGTDMIDGLQMESLPFSSSEPIASSSNLNYQLTISGDFNLPQAVVPLPGTLVLFILGLIGLRVIRRKF